MIYKIDENVAKAISVAIQAKRDIDNQIGGMVWAEMLRLQIKDNVTFDDSQMAFIQKEKEIIKEN